MAGPAPFPFRTTHFSALGSSSSFFRDSLPPQINSDHDPQRTPQLPAVRCGPLVPSSCRTELMRGGGGAHTWTIERRSADEPRREGGNGREELNTVPPQTHNCPGKTDSAVRCLRRSPLLLRGSPACTAEWKPMEKNSGTGHRALALAPAYRPAGDAYRWLRLSRPSEVCLLPCGLARFLENLMFHDVFNSSPIRVSDMPALN